MRARRTHVVAVAVLVLGTAGAAACGFGVDLDNLFGDKAGGGDTGAPDGPLVDGAPPDTGVPKMQVVQLGGGDDFACARRVDGTVMCWGRGDNGRLGTGGTQGTGIPALVKDVTDAIDLSVGDDHACIVRKSGVVSCWGQNDVRQLGDGTTTEATTPKNVVGLADVQQVAAGGEFTCALKKDATVHCWGNNLSGQLGDNTTTARSQPAVAQGIAGVTQVVAAFSTACALLQNGEVACWGENANGTVGSGTAGADVLLPVRIQSLSGVISLHAGSTSNHICAVLGTGEIRCWGYGGTGQLGNATSADSASPVSVVSIADGSRVATGSNFSCAVRKGGNASCWGGNDWHQLGLLGATPPESTNTPLPVDGLAGVTAIAAGGSFVCALHSGGEKVSCWGSNRSGSLGRNTIVASDVPVKASAPASAHVGMGREHTCAIDVAGAVSCWGMNTLRQQSTRSFSATGTPTTVAGFSNVSRVTGGDLHTCAIVGTQAQCIGYGSDGNLGNGQQPYMQTTPVVFNTGGAPATDVGAGYHFTCALLGAGVIGCAGTSADGRLGSPGGDTSTPRAVLAGGPVDAGPEAEAGPPPLFASVNKLFVGRHHSCAIHMTDRLSCWGLNTEGQLGTDSGASRTIPVQVPLPSPPVDAALGEAHTCAALQDGSVRCWGRNGNGQLSGGGASGSMQRVPNLAGKTAKGVAAGDDFSCALLVDNTVVCWGAGVRGQLGNGARADAPQPVVVKDLGDVKRIAAEENRACAVKNDASVWCWGTNALGQLGDGTVMQSAAHAPLFGY